MSLLLTVSSRIKRVRRTSADAKNVIDAATQPCEEEQMRCAKCCAYEKQVAGKLVYEGDDLANAQQYIECPCHKSSRSNSLFEDELVLPDDQSGQLLTPDEFTRQQGAISFINQNNTEGRSYLKNLEEKLLKVSITNLLAQTGEPEMWVTSDSRYGPKGVRAECLVPAGAGERYACFTFNKRYRGTFKQVFELRDFPLDEQWLALELHLDLDEEKLCFAPCAQGVSDKKSAELGSCERIFAPDSRDLLMLEPGHCPALAEFYLFKSVDTYTLKTPKHKSRSSKSYSRQRFQIHVRRKWGSYFANIIVTMWLITSLAFLAWFVPVTDAGAVASRLSYLVTLLLSAISFRFVVRSYLPAISYLTMLDSFTLVSTLFVALAAAEAAFISLVNRPGWWTSALRAPGATILYSAESIDSFAWWALLAGWVAYCLYWVKRFWTHWRSLDKNSFHMDNDYEKKHRPGNAAPRPPLTCPECQNAIALVSAFDIMCENAFPWCEHVEPSTSTDSTELTTMGLWLSLWKICFPDPPPASQTLQPTNIFDRVFVHRHKALSTIITEAERGTYKLCRGSHKAAVEFDVEPVKGNASSAASGTTLKETKTTTLEEITIREKVEAFQGERNGWRFRPDINLEHELEKAKLAEAAVGTPAVE